MYLKTKVIWEVLIILTFAKMYIKANIIGLCKNANLFLFYKSQNVVSIKKLKKNKNQ